MDFVGQLWEMNHTPEQQAARDARRVARLQGFVNLAQALPNRAQHLLWSLQQRDPEATGSPIGSQHPGQAAILAVRAALASYDLPVDMRFHYAGMRRYQGHGAHHVSEGIVTVQASFRTLSGVQRTVDIPVIVHAGQVLEPAVVIENGAMHVIAQSTFDDLIDRGTIYQPVQSRETMFSPPPDQRPPQKWVPVARPGLFGIGPNNRMHTQAYVRAAIQGHHAGLPEFNAMRTAAQEDHMQPAERDLDQGVMLGDEVELKKDLHVAARDGQRWFIGRGTKGHVIRDVDGTGSYFHVHFPEISMTAKVSKGALR